MPDYTHFTNLAFDNLFARKSVGQEVQVMDSAGNLSIGGLTASNLATTGTLSVTGVTTLATSLTGVVKATAGVISAATLVNADVSASAAIAGTKISPNFGSQAISTTGTLAAGATTVTGTLSSTGDFSVNTNALSVAASTKIVTIGDSGTPNVSHLVNGRELIRRFDDSATLLANSYAALVIDNRNSTDERISGGLAWSSNGSGNYRLGIYGQYDTGDTSMDMLFATHNGSSYAERSRLSGDGAWTWGANSTTPTHRINTSTATTVGAAGGASALPATPTGYIIISVNGTDRKIPYYAT